MGKAAEKRIDELLGQAEEGGSCLVPHEERDRKALRRRLKKRRSDLLCPVPGVYVRREHWRELKPDARALHVMRGLAELRPGIVFCAQSAALAWGLPVSWHLLRATHVMHERGSRTPSTPRIVSHEIKGDAAWDAGGLRVTSFWRTVFDCLASFPFEDALAIADAALRRSGLSRQAMAGLLCTRFRHHPGVRRAAAICVWAEPAAESGGESIARANMVKLGYAYPTLQLTLPDPANARRTFRVDFSWRDAAGRLIIGELDGDDKYLSAAAGPVSKLLDERKREALRTVYRPSIARFSLATARSARKLSALLDLHGVPRGAAPELDRYGVPVPPPGFAERPTVRGQGVFVAAGMRVSFVEEVFEQAA